MTPFAVYLQNYMWSQRPPLNRSTLAQRVNMPKQTVNTWFINGAVPRPTTVILLAKRLGLSPRELLNVAGYDADRYISEMSLLTPEDKSVAEEFFLYLVEQITHDTSFTEREKHRILEALRVVQERYVAGDTGDSPDPKVSSLAR